MIKLTRNCRKGKSIVTKSKLGIAVKGIGCKRIQGNFNSDGTMLYLDCGRVYPTLYINMIC